MGGSKSNSSQFRIKQAASEADSTCSLVFLGPDGDTLYFVADGNGGHTFSVTLEEHQAAVNRLLGRQ